METEVSMRRRAVQWCRSLAGWFPALRPGPEVLAAAEQIAARLGPNDGTVPVEDVRSVRDLIGRDERRRLVDSFVADHGDQWAEVSADAGDVGALEVALIEGAASAAIVERRLPHVKRLADLEAGRAPCATSRDALLVTLLPETVWSVVELTDAEKALASSTPESFIATLETIAASRGSDAHARRVQLVAAALSRQLPAREHPRASALLGRAYADAADNAFARQVADRLLGIYVVQQKRLHHFVELT